jgi:hypothetical protein
MTFDELNENQRIELKQHILEERNERTGEGTSYGELALADDLVSDEDLRDRYEGTVFSEDDFECSSHMRTVKVERIPQWAVCYLVNSDDSGLTPEDKKMVDEYVKRLLKEEHLRLVCPIDGSENEFCAHPAFGLACETVDFNAEEVPDDERDWEAEALEYAESIGVYEYKVNGRFIEYWSFYGKSEGWYFIRYDLREKRERFRGANIPWDDEVRLPAPGFLRTKSGATKYNYMVG